MSLTIMQHPISTRPVVLRAVAPGEKLGKAIVEAGKEFQTETGHEAQFAFVLSIPAGVSEGQEVKNIMLVQADWVPPGQVAVGAGGMEIIEESKRIWKKKGANDGNNDGNK